MGLTAKSPLTALTECVEGVRRILAGDTVDAEGNQFVFRSVPATHRPDQDVPILTGVLGPKSLRLSGRIADGTVMSVLSGTRYLEVALEQIGAGMAESGRTEHAVPTFALFSVATDSKAARAAVRPTLAVYLVAVGPHNPLTAPYSYNDHLAELIGERSRRRPCGPRDARQVGRRTRRRGDPDEVAERITALGSAGATSVVLSSVNPATRTRGLELLASSLPGR